MLTPVLRFLEHAKTTSRDLMQRSELTQVAASRLPPYRFPQDVRPPTHTDCRPIPGLEGVRLHLADHVLPLWHAVQIERTTRTLRCVLAVAWTAGPASAPRMSGRCPGDPVDTLHGPIGFSMPAPFLKPLRRIGHLATSRSSRIYALAWDLVALDVMTDAIAHATLRFATTSSAVQSTDKGSDKPPTTR
jgi:hypothetical protein